MRHCWCGLQPEDPLRAKHCRGSHLGRMVDVERPRKPNLQIRSISAGSTQTKGRLWNITLKIPRDCFKPLIRFGPFRSFRKLLLEPLPCSEKPKDYLWAWPLNWSKSGTSHEKCFVWVYRYIRYVRYLWYRIYPYLAAKMIALQEMRSNKCESWTGVQRLKGVKPPFGSTANLQKLFPINILPLRYACLDL